jgi:CDP-6-deoxy-D-xylo-4-hexulose-3-dehydrase
MEGGMIVTDEKELYHILLSLRAHGWTRNLPKKNLVTGTKSDDAFEESFKFVLPGYNVRPLEIEGAVGLIQLSKLDSFNENRRLNAKYFNEKIVKKYQSVFYFQKEIESSSWFGFSLIFKDNNKELKQRLLNTFNKYHIEYRPIVAGDFTKNPVMKYYTNWEIFCNKYMKDPILSNTKYLDCNGLYVGNHQVNIYGMIDLLDKAIEECLAV